MPVEFLGSGNNTKRITTSGAWTVYGQSGNDSISISSTVRDNQTDKLFGGDGDDNLGGGRSNDRLYGGSGRDTLDGGDGNDILDGDADDADLNGVVDGNANDDGVVDFDTTAAGHDDDILDGGAGIDLLLGRGGNDYLSGGRGNDTIYGGSGEDFLNGGFDNDILDGGSGNDQVLGSMGNDVLKGGSGDDALSGGLDNDILHGDQGADRLDGGPGIDVATYSASGSGVSVTLSSPIAGTGGDGEGDVLSDIENLVGSAHNDSLTGDSLNNELRGGLGADTLDGMGGVDTLDYRQSTQGVFVQILGSGASVTMPMTRTIGGVVVPNGEAAGDTVRNVEIVLGSGSNDFITADIAGNTIVTATNNVLNGGAGNDTLFGGGGDDTLIGGAGGDLIADLIVGSTVFNSGVDTADYSASQGAVTINLSGAPSSGGDAQGDQLLAIENVRGSRFADTFNGTAADNLFEGLAGADRLNGSTGFDTASYVSSGGVVRVDLALASAQSGGDAAGDLLNSIENLHGSRFSDTLRGDTANNLLRGNGGADILDGRTGTDTADYSLSPGGVTVALSATGTTTATGGDAQGDRLTNIENLTGSAFADSLTGSDAPNVFRGGAGGDAVNGGLGVDTIEYTGSPAGVTVVLDGTTAGVGGDAAGDILTNMENVSGTTFDDRLTGNAINNLLVGGSGNDILDGGVGNDILDAGSGNDTLVGGAGGDVMVGGSTTLPGSGGVDTADYSASSAAVRVLIRTGDSAGLGQAPTYNGNPNGDAAGDGLINIENLIGSAFDDTLIGDAVLGGVTPVATANLLDGRAGDDLLQGGGGADTLLGGLGNDRLEGGAGVDLLDGGDGIDISIGGTELDVFHNGIGIDYIVGYQDGEDVRISSWLDEGEPPPPVETIDRGTVPGLGSGTEYALHLRGTGQDTYLMLGEDLAAAQARSDVIFANAGGDIIVDPFLVV